MAMIKQQQKENEEVGGGGRKAGSAWPRWVQTGVRAAL